MLSALKNFYQSIIAFGDSLQSPLLLAIRLYWGYHFFISGWGKLEHIQTTAHYFSTLHLPFPLISAALAGGAECIGGACLVAGLASRLASIPLVITMIVALLTAHWGATRHLFSDSNAFISQAPFNFLLASLIILAFGPGKFSLDYLLGRWVFRTIK